MFGLNVSFLPLVLSASHKQATDSQDSSRLPLQTKLPGQRITAAALSGAPICKFHSSSRDFVLFEVLAVN